ncbi:MAG: hypothetical protein Roseis2KO_46770 [Roseivirga sp.]
MNIKILFTFLVVLAGCSTTESPNDATAFYTTDSYEELAEIPGETPSDQEQPYASRKLIKNGTLEFETEDLQKTLTTIKQAADAAGGYIANEHSTTNHSQFWNSVTVRMPSSEFDNFITLVSRGVDKFDKREIKSQDVTEEYVDLQARIEAKKKLEQRYLEILKTADTVKDILQVEAQAGKIREDIERAEGRLRFLESQTSMSTVNIGFYKTTEVITVAENTFIASIKDGLMNGVSIIEAIIIGLVNIWPLLILGLGGWFLYRHNIRKAKTQE